MSILQDWIFSKAYIDKLDETDSMGGIQGRRKQLISKTIWLMEDISKTLNLDRKVMSTAAVYFHRFFMFHSFSTQNRFPVALACLFLASKVEERPIKLNDVVSGFNSVYTKNNLLDMPKRVLLSERILLNTLGFELNVLHPLLLCGAKLKELRGYVSEESNKALYQSAVNFINDSYRSALCLQYTALEIGMALLFLATIQVGVKPNPPSSGHRFQQNTEVTWLELLTKDVEEDKIRVICTEMVDFYNSGAFMSQPKQLEVLKKSTYETLGLPMNQDNSDQDSLSIAPQGSPSASIHEEYEVTDSYEQMFEKEEEETERRVTVSRVMSSSTKIETFENEEIPPPPPAETPSIHGYSSQAEETPLYIPPPPNETPNASDTPSFADLPSMRITRERSVSISEESCPGTDYKRARY